MKYLTAFRWGSLLLATLSTNASAWQQEADNSAYPCWLNDLSFNDQTYLYGAARTMSASLLPPLHFAKLNAINNWALAAGLDQVSVQHNLAPRTSFKLNGTTLYFVDDFKDKNAVYSLVSETPLQRKLKHTCSKAMCQPANCAPEWLCQNESEQLSLFGIAAQTAHPNGQIRQAILNAQSLSKTVRHALVQGQLALLNIDSSYVHQSNIQQTFKITELTHRQEAVKVGKLCHYKGNLVSQIRLPQSRIGREQDWLSEPNLAGYSGSVGHAKGYAATGRLSDLIQIAARRGLFELAKSKQLKVDSDLKLEVNDSGYYSLIRKSEQTTESIISAFIADMKMELNDNFQPEVFIWLLENKG